MLPIFVARLQQTRLINPDRERNDHLKLRCKKESYRRRIIQDIMRIMRLQKDVGNVWRILHRECHEKSNSEPTSASLTFEDAHKFDKSSCLLTFALDPIWALRGHVHCYQQCLSPVCSSQVSAETCNHNRRLCRKEAVRVEMVGCALESRVSRCCCRTCGRPQYSRIPNLLIQSNCLALRRNLTECQAQDQAHVQFAK